MYDELKAVDSGKHEIVVKWQLFERAGDNIPLTQFAFDYAYWYGEKLGYHVTASVFDNDSLQFLLQYKIPFIKIANNRKLDELVKYIPRTVPVYISIGDSFAVLNNSQLDYATNRDVYLACISQYPAKMKDYEHAFSACQLHQGTSDHTADFELYRTYKPKIIEWHYKLADSTGLDAGTFARTPEQLREVIG
jgi:sialic acid synthase SpsE